MQKPRYLLWGRLLVCTGLVLGLSGASAENQRSGNAGGASSGPQFNAVLEQRNPLNVGETARLKIERTGDSFACGVEVKWGDGQTESLKISGEQASVVEHVYAQEGNYPVVVDGKMVFRGIGSALPCTGPSQVSALLVGRGTHDASQGALAAGDGRPALPTYAARDTVPLAKGKQAPVNGKVPDADKADAAVLSGRLPAGKRVALLIGNASYGQGIPPLANPPKDVNALQLSLKKLNFDVQVLKDGDLKEMGRAVKNFGLRAQDAQVALFYYSGHGIQARDENFLMPVGSKVESEADLDIEAMPLKALMRQIEDAHPKTTVVVLDACRDNPVAARFQTASKGLKLVGLKLVQNPPPNTLLVYASLPGTTATDNGVFAKELASQITQPNVGIRTVFDKVGMAVRAASGNRQNIQRDDQLSEDVVLLATAGPVGTPGARTSAAAQDAEDEAWQMAKSANSAAAYDAFLVEYPRGKYASAARIAKAARGDGISRTGN